MPPLDGSMPPLDGSMPPLVWSMPPLDGSIPPLDGAIPPLGGSMPPLDGSIPPRFRGVKSGRRGDRMPQNSKHQNQSNFRYYDLTRVMTTSAADPCPARCHPLPASDHALISPLDG
eukprot:5076933-Pyramimonas_sp.AAC.1